MSAVSLDGEEALYALLDGFKVSALDENGQPVPLEYDGKPVPAAVTHYVLPEDLVQRIENDRFIALLIRNDGFLEDAPNRTEVFEQVVVEVYARTRDLAMTYAKAIEQALVDHDHDVPGVGFIDDVRIHQRRRAITTQTTTWAQVNATYTLVSRPD